MKHSITFLHSCPCLPPPIVHVLGYLAGQGANYPPQKGVALCIYMYWGLTRGGRGGGPCKANPKWDWSVIGGEDERRAIASHVRQLTVSEFADGVNNKPKGCRLCGKVLRLLLKYLSSQFQVVGYILEGPLKCDRQCLLVQMFIQGRRMFSCLQMSHPPLPLLIIAERLSHAAVLRHLNRPHPWWTH